MIFTDELMRRYQAYLPTDALPEGLYIETQALIARAILAEEVIEDAEHNLGVVNPLLVDAWREAAGKEATIL